MGNSGICQRERRRGDLYPGRAPGHARGRITTGRIPVSGQTGESQPVRLSRPIQLFECPAPVGVGRRAHNAGWDVILDAAAFVPTSPLDLSAVRPDFVPVSFYKMFGYPTGLGAFDRPQGSAGKIAPSLVRGRDHHRRLRAGSQILPSQRRGRLRRRHPRTTSTSPPSRSDSNTSNPSATTLSTSACAA